MPVHEIEDLRHDRATAFERMKEINDKALDEKRDLTAEEQQEYDTVEQDFDKLTRQIDRQERLEGLHPLMNRAAATGAGAGDGEWSELEDEERKIPEWLPAEMRANIERAKVEGRKAPSTFAEFNEIRAGRRPQDDPEYRWAWFRYMTVRDHRELSPEETRTLSKATAAAGANLVPTSFQRELIQSLRDFGVVRQIARVATTDSGETLQWPSATSHGVASWIAENAAYPTSDEAFGQVSLSAFKAGTMMQVSEELLVDSAFDLDAYIRGEFGQRIGVLENTGYTVGSGSGQPSGWNNNAAVGVTAAAGNTTTIPADNIFDLIHSIPPPYRRGAVFVGNDLSIKALRKLKDSTNNYLWAPGLTAGAPDVLLAYPIYADPDVPAPAVSARSLGFGNFQMGYTIRDVNGIAMQRLNELFAGNGQVGFRAYHRTEGKIVNANAIKVFVHSAT